jgi:hypothetical protein
MNARIKRRPADEVLREIEAAEKVEQRKADKESRKRVSDQEGAIAALFAVWGCTPEEQETLRIIINLTKGSDPGQSVIVIESEAGRMLRGNDGLTEGSYAKRYKRRWLEDIERDLQGRIKKRIGERLPGKLVYKGKDGKDAKPKSAEYRVELTQIICDVIRLTNLARGKRRTDRFRAAALAVHAELPDYIPQLTVVGPSGKIKKETANKDRAGSNTRAMTRLERDVTQLVDLEREKGGSALLTQYNRIQAKVAEVAMPAIVEADPEAARDFAHNQFIEAARAQIALAREQGPEALEELQARLFSDLGTLFADPEAPEDEAELLGSNFSENLQKGQQNQVSDSEIVDKKGHFSTPLQGIPPLQSRPDLVYEREVFDP